jgi:4'-phosphopantetheinyl transferase
MSDATAGQSASPCRVDVWRVGLHDAALDDAALTAVLSDDERRRAARYRFADKRREFVVTRAALRRVIGQALGEEPASLRFTAGPYGKPSLPAEANPLSLRFNVSHTDGLALIALTRQHAIGVDVERVRDTIACDRLAERFFSDLEHEQLMRVGDARDRRRAFFRCWTCKEAYVKALGRGFAAGLDAFDVSVALAQPARLIATRPDASEAARWSLFDLEVGRDHVAALAVQAERADVRLRDRW